MTLPEKLRVYRERRGLTLSTLGQRCRALAGQVRGFRGRSADVNLTWWESSTSGRRPSPAQLEVLALALGLSDAETRSLLAADLADELVRGSRVVAAELAA